MTLSTRFSFAFLLSALVLVLPELAMATTLDSTIGGALCDIVALATGNAGKAIATAAIVFLGIGAFFGKVNWGLAMMISLGVILIFGAAIIAASLQTASGETGFTNTDC